MQDTDRPVQPYLYRYVGQEEMDFILRTGIIQSKSPKTFYTRDYYTSASEAQRRLAMSSRPKFRVGPIPEGIMPSFDAVAEGRAQPAFGMRGGGHECATAQPLVLGDFVVPYDYLEV